MGKSLRNVTRINPTVTLKLEGARLEIWEPGYLASIRGDNVTIVLLVTPFPGMEPYETDVYVEGTVSSLGMDRTVSYRGPATLTRFEISNKTEMSGKVVMPDGPTFYFVGDISIENAAKLNFVKYDIWEQLDYVTKDFLRAIGQAPRALDA